MSKPQLVLIGAGGHTHACIDVIEQHGQYQIAGLVGLPEELNSRHLGYNVFATDTSLPDLAKSYQYAIITVGQIRISEIRRRLYQHAAELGFQLPVIVAPTAHVSRHAAIGSGTIVMNGAIVNAGALVGKNCIINSRALLEHSVTVADHCHIATGAILNGNVHIGSGSFVGSGSIIKEGIVLGEGCLVGMGLSVRHDQADHSQLMGGDRR